MVAWFDEIVARNPAWGAGADAAAGAAVQLEQRAQRVLPSPVGAAAARRRGARGLLARAGPRLHRPVLLRAAATPASSASSRSCTGSSCRCRRWPRRRWRSERITPAALRRARSAGPAHPAAARARPAARRRRAAALLLPRCACWSATLARPARGAASRWRSASSSSCSATPAPTCRRSVDGRRRHARAAASSRRPEDIAAWSARWRPCRA